MVKSAAPPLHCARRGLIRRPDLLQRHRNAARREPRIPGLGGHGLHRPSDIPRRCDRHRDVRRAARQRRLDRHSCRPAPRLRASSPGFTRMVDQRHRHFHCARRGLIRRPGPSSTTARRCLRRAPPSRSPRYPRYRGPRSRRRSSRSPGSTITVTYAGLPGNTSIVISPTGTSNVTSISSTNGQSSGTATFTAPAPGAYVAVAVTHAHLRHPRPKPESSPPVPPPLSQRIGPLTRPARRSRSRTPACPAIRTTGSASPPSARTPRRSSPPY